MDEESFRAFVHARSGALMRTAYLLTADQHLAQDLLQTALEKTALRWGNVSTNPEAYVRRAMYHEAVSWWRRRGRRVVEHAAEAVPESPSNGGFSDAADDRVVLHSALARLTPKQRAVLVLRFYEDCSEAQAAGLLGCSISTVKSQTRHALERLRTLAPELAAFCAMPDGEEVQR